MTEYKRDKILPEDLVQRTNLQQHNFMIAAINDIDGRQADIEDITNINIDDIVDLKTDVVALSNEKLDKADIDADLHFGDITVTCDGTAVIMSLDVLNPTTNVVTPISFTIPGATSAQAGTMDASSVAWIAGAEERISALEGLSDVKAVADLTGAPTQVELTTGWVAVAGKQPETGDILQDINNSKLWVFVGTDWVLYGTIVTVPLATTSTIGGVCDTSLTAPGNRWYVHVEADGRLSLIGGDSLSTLVDTTIPALQSATNSKVSKSGDVMTGSLSVDTNTQYPISIRTDVAYPFVIWNKTTGERIFGLYSPPDDNRYLQILGPKNNNNSWTMTANDIIYSGIHQLGVDPSADDNSTQITSCRWVNSRLSTKQDTLTFDDAPVSGSNNPVKSGGVYDALDGKQDSFSLYEHTIRVTGTQSGGQIIKFTLTVLNKSSTVFTIQTLRDYLGYSEDTDYKECSGITLTMSTQMEVRYITSVRGGHPTEFILETVNPATGGIDILGLSWTGGYAVTLADKVRQIV